VGDITLEQLLAALEKYQAQRADPSLTNVVNAMWVEREVVKRLSARPGKRAVGNGKEWRLIRGKLAFRRMAAEALDGRAH